MEQDIKIQIPKNARRLIDILQSHGDEAYLVGGCVRDAIMGNKASDIDIATSSPAQNTIDILRNAGIYVVPTGLQHGTITAILESSAYEITTYRIDGIYSDSRHPDTVRFCTSITDDLSRRDFTINAIAYNEHIGIVDPFGGIADIGNKIIRCVGDPNKRFSEDALRIMRALRFSAQLCFEIESKTSTSLIEYRKLLLQIANERIGREFEKLLVSKNASCVLANYPQIFETILQVNTHNNKWNLAVKALLFLDTTNLCARLATLAIGFDTQNNDFDEQNHECKIHDPKTQINTCASTLKHLRFSRNVITNASQIIRAYYLNISNLSEGDIRLCLGKYGENAFLYALDIKKAYTHVLNSNKTCEYVEQIKQIEKVQKIARKCLEQNMPYRICDLAISGKDLIDAGFEQGSEIGDTLNKLLELVVYSKCENSRDELLKICKSNLLPHHREQ